MDNKPGKRRQGREFALQILYQFELSAGLSSTQIVSKSFFNTQMLDFFEHFEVPDQVSGFAAVLAGGVVGNIAEIDAKISENAENWRLERMDKVDRIILRIAIFELFFAKDLTKSIIMDEAIEIAKKFGSERSAAFVNGVLDRIAQGL